MSAIEILFVMTVFLGAFFAALAVLVGIDKALGPILWPKYHRKDYWW
jgi:hypothetical protein